MPVWLLRCTPGKAGQQRFTGYSSSTDRGSRNAQTSPRAYRHAGAQAQVERTERTERKQRATISHHGGLPLTKTLGVMNRSPLLEFDSFAFRTASTSHAHAQKESQIAGACLHTQRPVRLVPRAPSAGMKTDAPKGGA